MGKNIRPDFRLRKGKTYDFEFQKVFKRQKVGFIILLIENSHKKRDFKQLQPIRSRLSPRPDCPLTGGGGVYLFYLTYPLNWRMLFELKHY